MYSIGKAGQAAEQYFQADKNLRQTQIKSKQDFDFWKRKFKYYCTVYKARVSDVEKANESVRLARIGHRAGVRTNTDLLDAELELFHARAGAVNAQEGAIEALINLEMATGQKLYEFTM
jgi:outer membrane protein TolC